MTAREKLVFGLDVSLTSTGYSVVGPRQRYEHGALGSGEREVTVGRIQSKPPKLETLEARAVRMCTIRDAVTDLAGLADLVVIEGPSYASRHGKPHDRSGLWWLIVDELVHRRVPVVEVTPNQRAKYATGKGSASKDAVLAAVVRRYLDVDVAGNDEADALVLACMGARHLGEPVEQSLPQVNLSAMDAVRWSS